MGLADLLNFVVILINIYIFGFRLDSNPIQIQMSNSVPNRSKLDSDPDSKVDDCWI